MVTLKKYKNNPLHRAYETWVVDPDQGCSHYPNGFWSSYDYRIHCQSERLLCSLIGHIGLSSYDDY